MKNRFRNIKENYKLVFGVLIAGLFLGWLFFHPSKEKITPRIQVEGHEEHNRSTEDLATWTCSMHPQIRQDKPGQCPICAMDLIPVHTIHSAGVNFDPNEVVMTESAAKLADIQTMKVTKGTPQKLLYLQGKVLADERNMAELTARFGGRIEQLFVNFTGQSVKKGEKLAKIYSPDLITAQRELLEAVLFKENRASLYSAVKAKLKLWDLTDDQITGIEEKGEPLLYFNILSPISGTVMMRHVALGDYVKEGSALFQVTDLSKVWVMLDAYESDLPWINAGDQVEITIRSIAGRKFEGKVAYIDPFIDASSRIARVRVELPNEGLKMKPEMFANGILHSNIAESSDNLLIPKSSILWTGKRAIVYVKVPDRASPSFLYREITLGPEAGNFYVVADGLEAGEQIAVNGVFKIDAAAQLEGKPSMMNPVGGVVSTGHEHSSHQAPLEDDAPAQVTSDFKAQLQQVYDSYIPMKDAFVASDAQEVRKFIEKLGTDLDNVDMSPLDGDGQHEWMRQLGSFRTSIKTIAETSDLATQRVAFAVLNNDFYQTLTVFGLHHGTVYYQYCPMANGDEGAFWFSNSKEIENPYFGDEMLTCGETRETLEF